MREISLAVLGACLQLLVFYSTGVLLTKLLKMKRSGTLPLMLGYLTYFAVFELIAVPMTLLWCSLTMLSVIWGIVMIAVVVGAGILLIHEKKHPTSRNREIAKHSWNGWQALAILVVILQCLIVLFYQDTTVDATYYIGTVSASVYKDSLGRYDPYNANRLLEFFNVRYVFSAYQFHNAVWCKLLKIHPIVQSKLVMSAINVLISNLIVYQIGKRLFKDKRDRASLMVVFVGLLQLFSFSLYTSGNFLFTRSYEGKTLLANLSIPMVLYCACWLWQIGHDRSDKNLWIVLFLTTLSALTFSGSTIIFPVVVSAGILPPILLRKRVRDFIPCLLCLIPSFFYVAMYLAARFGILVLRAS